MQRGLAFTACIILQALQRGKGGSDKGGFAIAKGAEIWYTINNEIKAKHAKGLRVVSRIS